MNIKTWDELSDKQRTAFLEFLREKPTGRQIASIAGGPDDLDHDFALWLMAANRRCEQKTTVSIFDLADFDWRECFDNDLTPDEALQDALEAEGVDW